MKGNSVTCRTAFVLLLCLQIDCVDAQSLSHCERLEAERDRIYAQLRKPHSVSRARTLKARLREIRSRLAHECR